jgi:hypothetical protein
MGAGKTPEAWDAWTERMKGAHGNGNGHGPSLSIETLRLLPTPVTEDHGTDAPGRTGGASLSTSFVTNLLPTPCARDYKDSTASPATLQRNSPPIVALFSGEATSRPSDAGSESPGGEPPDLLSLIEQESA